MPSLAHAHTLRRAGLFLTYGGFLIAYSKLPPHGYPLFYFSPFSWATRSISVNEFQADDYAAPFFPGGPSRGSVYADVFGIQFSEAWRISGPFVLLGYWLLFGLVACSLVLARSAYPSPPGTTRLSEAALEAAALGAASDGDPAKVAPAPADSTAVVVTSADIVPTTAAPAAAEPSPPAPLAPVKGSPTAPAGAPTTSASSPSPAATPLGKSHHFSSALTLPRQAVTLTFQDITYDVFNPRIKRTVTLLRGVTGQATPGTLTALMGASGAGKTTLLDVLAGRKTTGTVHGSVLVNGAALSKVSFNRVSAYVSAATPRACTARFQRHVAPPPPFAPSALLVERRRSRRTSTCPGPRWRRRSTSPPCCDWNPTSPPSSAPSS